MTRSFQELGAVHRALFERLAVLRQAIALGDPKPVRAHFESFAAGLRAHARAEDEHLLPVYARLLPEPPGASSELLAAEHEKLRRLLAGLAAALPPAGAAGPIPAAERVALLDRSHTLVHLLDHHDQRERACFFAGLDAAVRADEIESLWAACDALHAAAGLPVEGSDAPGPPGCSAESPS